VRPAWLESPGGRRRIARIEARVTTLKAHSRAIALLLVGCLIHSGPVVAYLCVGHQSTMKACCPDEDHEASDHGLMAMPSESGLVNSCDPVTADGLSAHSLELPDPLAVGLDQLSLPAVEQSSEQVAATLLRPSFHGPPIYLTTLRVRR